MRERREEKEKEKEKEKRKSVCMCARDYPVSFMGDMDAMCMRVDIHEFGQQKKMGDEKRVMMRVLSWPLYHECRQQRQTDVQMG